MKKILCCFLMLWGMLCCRADRYDDGVTSLQMKVERSQNKLAKQAKTIAKERAALLAQLAAARSTVLKKESALKQVQKQQVLADEAVAGFDKKIKDSESLHREIKSFSQRFYSSISKSERKALAGYAIKREGADIVATVAEYHIRRKGGWRFPGETACADGRVLDGTFIDCGPAVFFTADSCCGVVDKASLANVGFTPVENTGITELASNGSATLTLSTELLDSSIVVAPGFLESIRDGGVVVVVLACIAVVCILVTLITIIRCMRLNISSWRKKAGIVADTYRESGELKLINKCDESLAVLVSYIYKHRMAARDQLEDGLCNEILILMGRYERFLPVLATSAAIAPMLGLLGTVSGMIESFSGMAFSGAAKSDLLASGMSEALITTEWGLCVAVPALLVHAWLSRMNKKNMATMQQVSIGLVHAFCDDEVAGE